MYQTDILIIGAGAVGTAIAREFSKYRIRVLVVDKNEDVGGDATRACSSIAGTGYANPPGSQISQLAHTSHHLLDRLIDDLEIPANRCGMIMPAMRPDELPLLEKRVATARENGDHDVILLSREQALAYEPVLSEQVCGALYSPREIAIDTFLLVVAQAENAAENGVEFWTDCRVTGIETAGGRVARVHTTRGEIETRYVINAAGLHCDEITRMVEPIDFTVHPRKGQFFILDKNTPCKPAHIIMPVPTPYTRGKLTLPTPSGNVLVGPTAEDQQDKDDTATTAAGLAEVEADIRSLVPGLVLSDAITEFSGLRPVRTPEGYHMGFSEHVEGFFGISGVRSDGVTTSLGIAQYVLACFAERGVSLEAKPDFVSKRRAIVSFAKATPEQQAALVAEDPRYGNVICRCETITEAEIVQAIHRVPGARSLDAIKRRVRAGMGRCQGGFCAPKVVQILSRELGLPPQAITKKGEGSEIAPLRNR